MNPIKYKLLLFISLLLLCFLFTGCYPKIHYRYRPCHDNNPVKPLAKHKIAIVTGRDGLLEIHEIDKCQDLILLRPGVEIHLLPGYHQIIVTVRPFIDPNGFTIYSKVKKRIKFDALEGHIYELQYIGIGDWTVNVTGSIEGGWDTKLVDLGKVNSLN